MAKRSAGIVVVRRHGDGWRYLLLRCYRYWDFPKGEAEPGEDLSAAARREVAEEAGLGSLDFPWGHVFQETPPYAGGKVARYYLARSDGGEVRLGVNPQLGRPEHHEHRWVDLVEGRRLLNERVRRVLDWAAGLVEGAPRAPGGGGAT